MKSSCRKLVLVIATLLTSSHSWAGQNLLSTAKIEGEYDSSEGANINFLRVLITGKDITVIHVCGLRLARPTAKRTYDFCEITFKGSISENKNKVALSGPGGMGELELSGDTLV